MKKHIAKRSIAILLSLLVIITASGVGTVSAAWVDRLEAIPDASTAQEAVLHSWDDKALAELDGPYTKTEGLSNPGDLANLDYAIEETKTIGVRYQWNGNDNNGKRGSYNYSSTGDTAMPLHHVKRLYLNDIKFTAGTKVRMSYTLYINNLHTVSTATSTNFPSGDNDNLGAVGMYFRMRGGSKESVVVQDRWGCWDGNLDGIYNINSNSGAYGVDKTYGYCWRTVISQTITVTDAMVAESSYNLAMIPGTVWDYEKNPIDIFEFELYEVDNAGKKTKSLYKADAEKLQALVGSTGAGARIECVPITVRVPNQTEPPKEKLGPFDVVGRTVDSSGFFSETRDFFLFDDFIPYNDEVWAEEKGMRTCKDLDAGDRLTVQFTVAATNVQEFANNKLQAVVKARYNTGDNVTFANVHFNDQSFNWTLNEAQPAITHSLVYPPGSGHSATTTDTTTTHSFLLKKETRKINGKDQTVATFQISIFGITQGVVDQLKRDDFRKDSGLNFLLGVHNGNYSNNNITLLGWRVDYNDGKLDDGDDSYLLVERKGFQAAYYGGCGPAYTYAYESLDPKYAPDLMTSSYIPAGKTFSGFDENADMEVDFPSEGTYTLRTDLQGDDGKKYKVKVLRKTIKGTETLAEQTFTANGERKIEEFSFPVKDLEDRYAVQIVNDTGNNLSVFSIQFLCDAQAAVGDTIYPDLRWALNDAPAGDTVTLLADVDLSKEAAVAVPFWVTLDLAGHSLQVQNFISFGKVVDGDGKSGQGRLVLTDRQGNATKDAMIDLQANNPQLPLYSSAKGGYQFFTCTTETAGSVKVTPPNVIKFGFRVKLPTVEAYDLLKENVNSGAVSLVATVKWTSTAFTYLHAVSKTTMGSFVDIAKTKINGGTPADQIKTAVTLEVSKVNHIGKGNTISCQPSLLSPLTGVTFQAAGADEYTYQG